jgi:hypothetical protein
MRGLATDPTCQPTADVYPIKLLPTILAPLNRLDDVPAWGWVAGLFMGSLQYLVTDSFTRLLFLVLLAAVADYWFGVKAAKFENRYDPRIAHAGAVGKAAGIFIVMLLRLVESWLLYSQLLDSRGAIATTIGVALLTVDLQSTAHHREALGAAPIPGLSPLLRWIRGIMKAPSGPPGGPNSP